MLPLSLPPAHLGGWGHGLGGAHSWAQLALPQPEQGGCPCLCIVWARCSTPSLLRACKQVISVICATFLPPVKYRRYINHFLKWLHDLNVLFKCPCSMTCPDVMHAGLQQPVKVKPRQEWEVKRCCCLWFVLFQAPGGWEHCLQVLSTKCGGISICLLSLSFFFPSVFKALTSKSAVKLLRTPAVVQLLETIHSVYSSTALRCTLMEQVEASFIIIINHYFGVICCF